VATPFDAALARIPGGYRPSAASAVVWLAMASGTDTAWSGGRLVVRGAAQEDDPFCPVYGKAFGGEPIPFWVAHGIATLDASLPDEAAILDALSPRDLVLSPDPAAARIPQDPEVADAAACILACRLLLACGDRLVPPALSPDGEYVSKVADASYLAALAGGEAALAAAARMAVGRSLFSKVEPPFTEDVEIEE